MPELQQLQTALADRYSVERELGAGGMATVYLAHDLKHDRPVALKVMRPEITASIGSERFLREIVMAARLQHPHIVMLIDSGKVSDQLYYVMSYVEGESLAERLKRERQLPVEDALQTAREVASALSYAHGRGVIHRDIKPDNILLSGGHAVVTDFGIGRAFGESDIEKLTQTGIALGTPAYMSPEQASGRGIVDSRTDIYAVGCVLYEMLAGQPPFSGPTVQAVLARHAVDPVPSLRTVRPTVPAEVEGAIMKALAKVPADRFPDMPAFLTSLQAISVPEAPPEPDAPVIPTTGPPAIAVLPFTNMSADPDQEYFCDGMAEELLSALGRVGGLRVVARTASFSFKGTQHDVRDIARSLHADLVLEGSVRKAGSRLRITAQLVKVPEGVQLWADRYDREMEDVFVIQDDISSSITAALRMKLGMEQATPLVRRPTANLEAYDAYLRGIHSFNKRSRPANEKAIELLERATTLDPGFALGFAALATAYIEHFFTHEPEEEWEERAFVAIEKARTLDPGLPEIYVAKGNLLWTHSHHFPHLEAITEYQRALAINPDLAEALNELARVYWHIGLLDPAFEALERAMQINPAFVDGKFRLAWLEMHRGNYERALSLFEGVPKSSLAPSVEALTAMTLLYLGRGDRAQAQLDAVDERYRQEPDFTSVKAIFLAREGQVDAARAMIDRALTDGRGLGHFHHVTNNVAVAYAVLKDKARALHWLEWTANDGFPCYPWFERDPCLHNLKGDPRFVALLYRLRKKWQVPELIS